MKCTNNADSGGVKIRKSDESNYLQKKQKTITTTGNVY